MLRLHSGSACWQNCTFSCLVWPRSARSPRGVWPAVPATTRHRRRWWHAGCPHKKNSDPGWAGNCPWSCHSQREPWERQTKPSTDYLNSVCWGCFVRSLVFDYRVGVGIYIQKQKIIAKRVRSNDMTRILSLNDSLYITAMVYMIVHAL